MTRKTGGKTPAHKGKYILCIMSAFLLLFYGTAVPSSTVFASTATAAVPSATDGFFYVENDSRASAPASFKDTGTYYYYNLLPETEQKIWDLMEELLGRYLSGMDDAVSRGNGYFTEGILFPYFSDISNEQMDDLFSIFLYSCPQYFFVFPAYEIYTQNGEKYLSLRIYQAFASGTDRHTAVKEMENILSAVQTAASQEDTDADKIRFVHDYLCLSATYNSDVLADGTVDVSAEEIFMSQSAYSALVLKSTVCAGYSKACLLMLRYMGIDAVVAYGQNHTWNKVRLDGIWYNVDCTADSSGKFGYTWFLKSDKKMKSLDKKNNTADHTVTGTWKAYVPEASGNTKSSAAKAVLPESAGGSCAKPELSVTPVYGTSEDGQDIISWKITVSAEKGSTVYYTTDGSTPSPAGSRSLIYKGPVTIVDPSMFHAVAYMPGKCDSRIANGCTPKTYRISYVLNGGTNSTRNPVRYAAGVKQKLSSPSRAGYTFLGWYTAKDFKKGTRLSSISKKTSGKLVLYAKWRKNK
jgi:uncharacterized repeat protein (TIGR02543 family)